MRIFLLLAALGAIGDPLGDSGSAPDIVHVTAAPAASSLVVTIDTAAAGAWDGAAALLDVDTTGDGRADVTYTLHSAHDLVTRDIADGSTLPTKATATLSGATLRYRIPLSELGTSGRVGLAVTTASSDGSDRAPDSGNMAVALRAAVRFAPAAPVHGRRFAVSGADRCKATIGASALRGSCSWLVPRTAAGKMLVVRVTAAGAQRTYRFRVR